jgi:hypothetical protein
MTDHELIAAVARVRAQGLYEDDPDWDPIDAALSARGFDLRDLVID